MTQLSIEYLWNDAIQLIYWSDKIFVGQAGWIRDDFTRLLVISPFSSFMRKAGQKAFVR